MENDFLHKISIEKLSKDTGLPVEEIAKLAGIAEARNLGKWAQEKPNGSRPNYNAIVRLLQKGATVETLFGVDYAATHQPAVPSEIARDSEFQEGLQAAMDAKIEAKVDAKVKAVVADVLREYGLPPRNGSV